MSKKLECAFPVVETVYNGFTQESENKCVESGMSKRFYAACAAMQGLIAHYGISFEGSHIQKAYDYADKLIQQENEI